MMKILNLIIILLCFVQYSHSQKSFSSGKVFETQTQGFAKNNLGGSSLFSYGLLSDFISNKPDLNGLIKITVSGSYYYTLQNYSTYWDNDKPSRTHSISFNFNILKSLTSLITLSALPQQIGLLSEENNSLGIVYNLPKTTSLLGMGDYFEVGLGDKVTFLPRTNNKTNISSEFSIGALASIGFGRLSLKGPAELAIKASEKIKEKISDLEDGNILPTQDNEKTISELNLIRNELIRLSNFDLDNNISNITNLDNYQHESFWYGGFVGGSINTTRSSFSMNYSFLCPVFIGGQSFPIAIINNSQLPEVSRETISEVGLEISKTEIDAISEPEKNVMHRLLFSFSFKPSQNKPLQLYSSLNLLWGESPKISSSQEVNGLTLIEERNLFSKIMIGITYDLFINKQN